MEIPITDKIKKQIINVIKPFLSQGASIKPLEIKDIHKVRAETLNLVSKKLVLENTN